MKKTLAFNSSLFLLSIALLLLILFPTGALALSGLKVVVHVNDSGSVCVSSVSQDLGCQYVHGPNQVNFEFSPGMVDVNERFKVCMNDNCKIAVNGPEKAPVDVYIYSPVTVNETTPNGPENLKNNENSPNYFPIFLIVGIGFILVVMRMEAYALITK